MWWNDLIQHREMLASTLAETEIAPDAVIEPGAMVDGPVRIGPRVRICSGAIVRGPVAIGEGSLIGNGAVVRGVTSIGRNVRVGYAAEIKNAHVGDDVALGPQSYVGDSVLEPGVYFGAQVRTSNHRLDGRNVTALHEGVLIDTGCEKLGCLVGEGAALGIQVIVLPGRTIAPGAIVGPGIVIEKNLSAGRYRLAQHVIEVAE